MALNHSNSNNLEQLTLKVLSSDSTCLICCGFCPALSLLSICCRCILQQMHNKFDQAEFELWPADCSDQ